MDGGDGLRAPHPYCLARSVPISAIVLAFCVLELTLSLRHGHSKPPSTFMLVLGYGWTIVVLAAMWQGLKCFRERALLLLFGLRMVVALLAGLMPTAFERSRHLIHIDAQATWSICALIALTLLYSSVQDSRRENRA